MPHSLVRSLVRTLVRSFARLAGAYTGYNNIKNLGVLLLLPGWEHLIIFYISSFSGNNVLAICNDHVTLEIFKFFPFFFSIKFRTYGNKNQLQSTFSVLFSFGDNQQCIS